MNSENALIGVAFQGLDHADGIGYLIPSRVLLHFFQQVKRNQFGVPTLGILTQTLDSPSMREFFGMPASVSGVLVARVNECGCAKGFLKKDDVLLKVGENLIASDGTIQLRSKAERVSFEVIVQGQFAGDLLTVVVWRERKEETLSIPLFAEAALAPPTRALAPQYLVWGGLVFLTLSLPYFADAYTCAEMNSGHESNSELSLYIKCDAPREFADQEVVLISRVLSDDCNQGFEQIRNLELKVFQGKHVRNLKQLAELLKEAETKESFVRFDFKGETSIVLKTASVLERQEDLLKRHKIGSWCFLNH